MSCKQCVVAEPVYEIKIQGEKNKAMLQHIRGVVKVKEDVGQEKYTLITIPEAEVKGFYDFCIEHMDSSQLLYRTDLNRQWQSFEQLLAILETSFIDTIITEQSMVCWAQPIVDGNKHIYGHEVLARFISSDNSVLSPAEVFGAARLRNRLFALDQACRLNAIRHAVHLPKKVFINFIPTSIYSPEHCLQSTIALSQQLGFEASKFVFEVVESEYVEDLSHLKRILKFYRDRGFQYALDDVGEGYNTLEVLEEIKPQYMKLDKAYVHGVAQSIPKQKTAIQLLNTAKHIGAIPLAEGIECEEDFAWLKQQGYELFQGYWLGRPAPIMS